MHQTKIIATIGPASQSVSKLSQMIKAGMAVARLNFSHGTHANHSLLIKNIRTAARNTRTRVAIMQDLQGPKIRIKELKRPLNVKKGQTLILGKKFDVDIDIRSVVKPGQSIFIQDGLIQLKVVKVKKNEVFCVVLNGGAIQSHKGVNLPDTKLQLPSLTAKDIKDLEWGMKKNFDLIAISFVRKSGDVADLRKQLQKVGKKRSLPEVVAKIEKPEAVKNINAIIKASDKIMIARGDLGVELPEEQIPRVQSLIIKKCRQAKKPVIVATQMLESMVNNPRPTRAEVEDVADAVIEGADYVMLSEETAFGKYPVEAVKEMQKIIRAAHK